jgi:hypothetical protein
MNVIGECALFAIILWRREHQRYKEFTTLVGFWCAQSLLLVALYPPDSNRYALATIITAGPRVVLVLAVLFDLLYWIVKPYLMIGFTRSTLYALCFAVLFVYAAYLAFTDPASGQWQVALLHTMNRSVDLALGGSVLLLIASRRMRHMWNVRERGITIGFLYLPIQFAIGFLSYRTSMAVAMRLDLISMSAFTAALIVWITHFLMHEGAMRTIGDNDLAAAEEMLRQLKKGLERVANDGE